MSSESVYVKYTGIALPTGATTTTVFDTSTLFVCAFYAPMHGLKRLQVDLVNSQAGTFNWQKSQDRGVTWVSIGTTAVAIAAPSSQFDFLFEEYPDVRLQWVNGGVTQTQFVLDMALSGERVKGN